MNLPRAIAGIFCGAGSLLLIYNGYIQEGMTILVGMMAFFVGEHNGYRNARKEAEENSF